MRPLTTKVAFPPLSLELIIQGPDEEAKSICVLLDDLARRLACTVAGLRLHPDQERVHLEIIDSFITSS